MPNVYREARSCLFFLRDQVVTPGELALHHGFWLALLGCGDGDPLAGLLIFKS